MGLMKRKVINRAVGLSRWFAKIEAEGYLEEVDQEYRHSGGSRRNRLVMEKWRRWLTIEDEPMIAEAFKRR